MRKRQIIKGINNSQKIRVIVNGVGFITTVEGMTEMCFTEQRVAVWNAIQRIADEKIMGFATTHQHYNDQNDLTHVEVQVDLI